MGNILSSKKIVICPDVSAGIVPPLERELALKNCSHIRNADGSGCICDLIKHAKFNSDWPIAKLVGIATYAQLVDAAPGLFEPFPDVRSRGNSSSSILTFNSPWTTFLNYFTNQKIDTSEHHNSAGIRSTLIPPGAPLLGGWSSREDEIPIPPNFVSTIFAEDGINPALIKRLLIRAVKTGVVDPIIEPLIRSSDSYSNPELTLGEIVITFFIYTVVISFIVGFGILVSSKTKRKACDMIGGCKKFV